MLNRWLGKFPVRLFIPVFLIVCSQLSFSSEEKNGIVQAAEVTKPASPTNVDIPLDVYKSPNCGCCGKWVKHAAQHGFALTTHHPAGLIQLKEDKGIAPEYQSCHTSVSEEGYVFEGHIPARYIKQFLANPPAGARGLTVPAMPVGSPGMEVKDHFVPYQVLLLKVDGSSEVFAEIKTPQQQYQ